MHRLRRCLWRSRGLRLYPHSQMRLRSAVQPPCLRRTLSMGHMQVNWVRYRDESVERTIKLITDRPTRPRLCQGLSRWVPSLFIKVTPVFPCPYHTKKGRAAGGERETICVPSMGLYLLEDRRCYGACGTLSSCRGGVQERINVNGAP